MADLSEVRKAAEVVPAPQDQVAQIIKRGEICIQTTLHRGMSGLSVSVKVHPLVEEFMRSLGSGEVHNVKLFGRHWAPVGAAEELNVYHLQTNPGRLVSDDGTVFRIDKPGQPFTMGPESNDGSLTAGLPNLNLSFLRLVGASDGAGVTFSVKGVYEIDGVRRLRDQIAAASRRFYVAYLKPVDMSVMVSTQELSL